MSDVITSIGKHLLLWVPDFGESEFPSVDPESPSSPRFSKRKMTSFLRLGAPSPDWTAEPGAELLALINDCGQPGDPRLDAIQDAEDRAAAADEAGQAEVAATWRAKAKALRVALAVPEGHGTNTDTPWSDDVRHRAPGNPGHGLESGERITESGKLHARGGWRDHSDGNRITTTYGDKVEVIRGNYKMVVLGRQDDPGEAMGWEAAGSHIDDFAPGTMPGASVFQEFIEDYVFLGKDPATGDDIELKGVWLLVNSTENVWQYERNAGNFRTEAWGNLHEEYVGSENPVLISLKPDDGMHGHPMDVPPYQPGRPDPGARAPWGPTGVGRVRSNPHIINKTWATKIEEYTGSARLPVPTTYSETWVGASEEKTTVTLGTIETTTVGAGTVSTTTVGGGTVETTTVGLGTVSTTVVGAGTLEATTVGGAAVSLTGIGGAQVEVTGVGGAIVGLTTSVANVELAVHAAHVEVAVVGVHADIKATGIEIELSATGLKIEGTTSGKEIELGTDDTETVTNKTETFVAYTRSSATDTISYTSSKEVGAQKTLTLTELRVVASTISLG